MIENVTTFVFFAVLAAFAAGMLIWQSRRILRRDALRRRLGELRQESDQLWTGGDDQPRTGDGGRRLVERAGRIGSLGQ